MMKLKPKSTNECVRALTHSNVSGCSAVGRRTSSLIYNTETQEYMEKKIRKHLQMAVTMSRCLNVISVPTSK